MTNRAATDTSSKDANTRQVKKKVVLTFPAETVNKPITYHLVKDFGLVTNILRAEISEGETGLMVLDLTGPAGQVEEGLGYLKELQVEVQEAARDILLSEEKCVDCGACTAVCKPRALTLEPVSTELAFDKDKCIFCELCVTACPTRAIAVAF